MRDKQIIINGIDVSICERHCSDNHNRPNRCYSDITESYRDCRPKENQCNFYITSIEKQLARKTQECEELKHNYNAIKQCNDNNMQTLDEAIKEKCEAEQELEKVKKQYKCYSCGTCNGKEDYYNLAGHHENAIKSLHKAQRELDQLKATKKQAEQQLNELRKERNKFKKQYRKNRLDRKKLEQKLELIREVLTNITEAGLCDDNKECLECTLNEIKDVIQIIDEVK